MVCFMLSLATISQNLTITILFRRVLKKQTKNLWNRLFHVITYNNLTDFIDHDFISGKKLIKSCEIVFSKLSPATISQNFQITILFQVRAPMFLVDPRIEPQLLWLELLPFMLTPVKSCTLLKDWAKFLLQKAKICWKKPNFA